MSKSATADLEAVALRGPLRGRLRVTVNHSTRPEEWERSALKLLALIADGAEMLVDAKHDQHEFGANA